MSPRRKAPSVCATPGCPTLTPQGGACQGCQQARAKARPGPRKQGYTRRWERTRRAYLREHRWCECEECEQLPVLLRPLAEHVHHKDGLGPLGPRGHDWDNLQALTAAHHSRETGRDTGFGTRT